MQEQDDAAVMDVEHKLISSRRVEGTPVFDTAGKKLGKIHSVMIGKRDGKVPYAMLDVRDFLEPGMQVYPLPWELLDYDVERDGYVVNISADQVKDAPKVTLDASDRPMDKATQEEINNYWGILPVGPVKQPQRRGGLG